MGFFNPRTWISAQRTVKEAHDMLSRGFTTVKVETYASLVRAGTEARMPLNL